MKNYRDKVLRDSEIFRPKAKFPSYPPYQLNYSLEEFFFEKYYFYYYHLLTEYIYLPIFWTNCYNNNDNYPIQAFLNSLDPDYKYFTVCLHADAPREKLPENTIVFSAGGNNGGIPIPLIASGLDFPQKEKDIFCSFIGSNTHPVREALCNILKNNPDYYYSLKEWSASINQIEENHFLDIMARSVFSLCPRGYGKTSYRLYEAFHLNSIPIYIYDQIWLPWNDILNWNEFSVLIHLNEVKNIKYILASISQEQIIAMQNKIKEVYPKYFSMDATFNLIIKNIIPEKYL